MKPKLTIFLILIVFTTFAATAMAVQPEVLFSFLRDFYFGKLVQGPDGSFYGTSADGGSSYSGTVFRVTTNGRMAK